jgi:hypothetical protein
VGVAEELEQFDKAVSARRLSFRGVGKDALASCPPSIASIIVNGGQASLCPPDYSDSIFKQLPVVIARLDRAIQYAAASRFNH